MPLVNNKVRDEHTISTEKALVDGKALVDSLIKVVACYRHLASCVGGPTDSLKLRDELRQTREKAQKLAVAICHDLTSHLRDKSLPGEQREEMALLWVAFSSSLELLHVDMCKVFHMYNLFFPTTSTNLVQTGIQGGSSEVAARALSLPDLTQAQPRIPPAGLEGQERTTMELEIGKLGHMIDDMEMKVNVLRWTVEPRGGQYADPTSSTNSASLALLPVDEERPGHQPVRHRSSMMVLLLLLAVVLVAATLSVCVVFFS